MTDVKTNEWWLKLEYDVMRVIENIENFVIIIVCSTTSKKTTSYHWVTPVSSTSKMCGHLRFLRYWYRSLYAGG